MKTSEALRFLIFPRGSKENIGKKRVKRIKNGTSNGKMPVTQILKNPNLVTAKKLQHDNLNIFKFLLL